MLQPLDYHAEYLRTKSNAIYVFLNLHVMRSITVIHSITVIRSITVRTITIL